MKGFFLKPQFACLLLALIITESAKAQKSMIYEVSLKEQIANSQRIVEGKIIDQTCCWNQHRDLIFTVHKVEVFKAFMGETASYIDVLTLGGSIDGHTLRASSVPNLRTGDVGLFMLKESKTKLLPAQESSSTLQFEVVSAAQGFYRYDLASNAALNPFVMHQDIRTSLYPAITDITQKQIAEYNSFDVAQYASGNELKLAMDISISSLSPLVATAGTQTLLTVKGSGFKDSKGKVEFKNANDGGASYIEALATEIISWSDTLIEVQIPSLAGTGTIRITDIDGLSNESADEISIRYAITMTIDSGYAIPTQLIDQNGQGGYLFHMHVDFDSNTPAKQAFTRAMNTWICASKVNWRIGLTTSTDETKVDGENVIRFDNGDELPMGVLGRCLSYSFICGTPKKDAIVEIDVIIDDDTEWNFDEANPGASQFDFETVMLHELGHGHQLRHVVDSNDVMFYGLDVGQVKRSLSENDVAGAAFIHDISTQTTVCFFSAMTDLECPLTGVKDNQIEHNLRMYPNPASTTLYINQPAGWTVNEGALFDLSGRKLLTVESGTIIPFQVDLHSLPGGYYIIQIQSENKVFTKQFIKK